MAKRSLLAAALLAALSIPSAADAQVRVSLQWAYPVEQMYVADFSPYGQGQQPGFLAITLMNGAAEAQPVVLEFEIRREAPSAARIFVGETDPFVLSTPIRRLTNRDLSSDGNEASIDTYEIGSVGESVTDQILESGRFPAGGYLFVVRVRTPQGLLLDEAELRLELTNVTRLELINPGRPFGDTPPVVNGPSPRFVWSPDADVTGNVGEYRLRVVPVQGAASPEEAMQGFASWETTTNATTALYPGAVSALPLEPGGTYAWQVTRQVQTSGGAEEVESPIYWFRMSESAGAGAGARSGSGVGMARALQELARALGLGDDLEGFRPTGRITVDGEPLGAEGLEALVRAISAGDVAVSSVTVR